MKRWNQSNFETGSLGMGEIFRVSKLIRFQHCDPAGIVFYPQYFVLFHEVMEDWFYSGLELKFADLIVGKRLGAPTVDIRGQFFAPSRLGETLEFSLLVRKIGASSIGLRRGACSNRANPGAFLLRRRSNHSCSGRLTREHAALLLRERLSRNELMPGC
jgi:acyl-CoA thioesterase FadM